MTDPMTPSPMPSEERHATTYRVIIGGLPERSLAEGIQRVLQGDDSPPFMTFAIEAEPLTRASSAEDRSRVEGLDRLSRDVAAPDYVQNAAVVLRDWLENREGS